MIPKPEEPTAPLTFERILKAQAAGCLASMLMIPTFAVLGALAGGAVGFGIAALFGGRNQIEAALMLTGMGIGFLAAGYAAIRLYLREAAHRIVVHADRLEWHRTGRVESFPFEEFDWIDGPSLTALRIKVRKRRVIALRADEWPVASIADALAARAVPVMVRSLNVRLISGESLDFRPASHLAIRYLISGTFFTALAAFLFYYWWEKIRSEKGFRVCSLPLLLLGVGLTTLVQVGRARSGVLLSRDGIRTLPSGPVIGWERLEDVIEAEDGASLRLDDGTTVSIGRLARNYAACVAIAKERLTRAD